MSKWRPSQSQTLKIDFDLDQEKDLSTQTDLHIQGIKINDT